MAGMQRKKLPIGIQTFAKIRENDAYYYVDKTPQAISLIEQGSYYFLSRPRRFGKSLFLDTLKELFEGNAALFTGLHAETHWDWSIKYQVLHFSFGGGVLGSKQDLENSLNEQLILQEEKWNITTRVKTPRGRFSHLIHHLAKTTGQRIVILIDEYDKPILVLKPSH